MSSGGPVILVLGSGQREYREYMLKRISERYGVVVFSGEAPTWEQEYIVDHTVIDPRDSPAIVEAARLLARRCYVVGVLTYHEPCVELAAIIGAMLGVPHCRRDAARRCRDKHAARDALRRAGVPSARSRLVRTRAEAEQAAESIGYPVVVKPRGLSASFGVSMAATPADLGPAFDTAQHCTLPEPWAHERGVVVEEYLDGPEISIDSVVVAGHVVPLIYARKLLAFPPYFEEVGHIVAPKEALVDDPGWVDSVLVGAHRGLGIDNAATHTEIRLTDDGPRVVEVNGRSGGDLIPYLGALAMGIDLPLAIADIAAGVDPDLSTSASGVAGIRFFYPSAGGRVGGTTLAAEVADQPWLVQLTALVPPGTEVWPVPGSLYHARVAFAVVTAATVEECAARLDRVAACADLAMTSA